MGEFPRKADGRRIFSAEFKRSTAQRILSGEKTLADVSREFDILPAVIRDWIRRAEAGATTAAAPRSLTGGDVRELMDRSLWARFGEATLRAPRPIQWLSDNGPQYTALASVLYASHLGLEPITTPAYSPQSNGLVEAFVKTFKRDYVAGAELWNAAGVLAQLPTWIEDYNTRAPHSALGMQSPAEYRAQLEVSSLSVQ